MKNYWKEHPDKYEKHKENMRRYHKTSSGKATKERAKKKFQEKNPDYMKEYMKRRQIEAKKNGICPRCLKNKSREKYDTCKECSNRYKNYHKGRK